MKCRVEPVCPPLDSAARTLDGLVDDYLARVRPGREVRLAWFANAGDLGEAIERAAVRHSPRGTLDRHQCRVGRPALRRLAEWLRARDERVRACGTFEELHDLVASAGVPRVGVLAVYDVSVRLGRFLGLCPQVVHLHAGTRKGAVALGLVRRRGQRVLTRGELPEALARLTPDEAEDFLCISASAFGALCAGPARRSVCHPAGTGAIAA